MLNHKLGKSTTKIGARKCSIVNPSREETRDFLNKYHIQGAVNGSVYWGLAYNNELVAVMVLLNSGGKWNLSRYATKYTIMGGFTKLFNVAPPGQYVTFADLCVSDGNLYERHGWTRDRILKPDYKYIYDNELVHKFNFRRKRFENDPNLLFDVDMTEKQMAALNGIERVYDCGKIRYLLDKPCVL